MPKRGEKMEMETEYIDVGDEIPKKKYYVCMTDKFMSGWGKARNKINKLVIGCNTYEEAHTIQKNAMNRPEMKYVNITGNKPRYNKNRYYVSYMDFSEMGDIWTK